MSETGILQKTFLMALLDWELKNTTFYLFFDFIPTDICPLHMH